MVTETNRPWRGAFSLTGVVVGLYLLGIAATAWLRLDTAWDSLAYHLPFAGIRAGIITHADYIIPAHHVALLNGFPPVVDLAKGLLWKLTGHVEATQLFNVLLVSVGAATMAWLYRVRFAVLVMAVLAVPIGQIEFASNYTDLPVNFLLAFALFSTAHSLISAADHRLRHTVATAAVLCLATTFKVTAIPFGVIIWAMYFVAAGLQRQSGEVTWFADLRQKNVAAFLAVAVGGGLLATGYGLVNWVMMGNPLFPVPIDLGPISFPGTVPASNWAAAAYLNDVPRALRWVVSVVEWHAFDLRPLPYIVAQGDVPESAMSYRMGGLFAYQLFLTVAMLLALRRKSGNPIVVKVIVLHAAMALVVSMVPGSHEMRYFFFWYLSLLWSAYHLIDRRIADRFPVQIFVASLAVSAIYITLITGGRYVYPFQDMPDSEELVQGVIRSNVRARLNSGQRHFCVADKEPLAFLYSRPFHEALAGRAPYQVSADVTSSVCQLTPPTPR